MYNIIKKSYELESRQIMKIYQKVTGSSAISGFEYDTVTEVLSVRFVSGNKKYDYPNIPEEVVRKWIAGFKDEEFSHGKYFHKNVRNYVG